MGSTAQSFYMTYGGTNWGWLGMPQNYTSYDYGAAIRETRQLDPKYYQDKLIGYLTQSMPDLTKTDRIAVTPPDNAAIVDTARRNPDTGAQFHVLRHNDSTSTAVDRTHIAIDFNARATTSYTYDDPDPALQYAGAWSHVANESYTGSDYQQTESFSSTAGDALTIPFTGTAIRWIGSKTGNHGYADVYVDEVKQATVDCSGGAAQAVLFQATGLADGPHTLKIVVTGTHAAGSTDNFVAVDAIDLPPAVATTESVYPVVPQKPGTAITLNGRDSRLLVAGARLGQTRLQYSTSELLTQATIGAQDVAVLYGDPGADGETVLRFATKPAVRGAVEQNWDPATGDLRLNYTHSGLTRVLITPAGQRPLLLLLADKPTAETFWRQDTAAGPVLVRGTHLLRTAVSSGRTLALTGDNGTDPNIEVFSTASTVRWNGAIISHGVIPAAAPIALPALTNWKHQAESPEAQPGFDDSAWAVADKTTTFSITGPGSLPVLYADDYGFHTGSTWYRGRFPSSAGVTGVHLTSDSGGGAQAFSAWVNGVFLGSSTNGAGNFTFPAGALKASGDNIVSVLTVNMGHEEDYNSSNGNKAARGLTGASLIGAPTTPITWRLQGARDVDAVRGPLSTGGLFGERAGWQLPGFDDRRWKTSARDTTPGVSWYRTTADLSLPKGQDTSIGLTFTDDPSHRYRAQIYVNGWMLGNYVNYLGPQHSFPIPNGILRTDGRNTIAIAVWNLDGTTGGLGQVSLTNYGSYASSLRVADVVSPGYDARKYAIALAPKVSVSLQVPSTVQPGVPFTATATVTGRAHGAATLTAPDGWTIRRLSALTWEVTPPTGAQPSTAALTVTVPYPGGTARDERIVGNYAPPPAGSVAVSDLPFLSATNGWGPVERDTSNGEQVAGDGKTITIAGQAYPKGLGTNAVSDVQVYLGGNCTRFTAAAGVDDEQNGAGTVTFEVLADGRALATTPVLKGRQPAAAIDVDVTGAQALELVVGDGGDGNGSDHGDWAAPTLTCG
ncbi:NPCBM/NEW2 domain-containing protein [Actinoplanes sp. NPDC026619]|uniref:NPCBM/NEW2 domain-containing protein n=1 Tax=Actinoplanes sp. NPDC026619 TaxID=3155798 RepID=UPI0033C2E431